MTKSRPIIFKGEMVKAILNGRKSQTRRTVKNIDAPCPYGLAGDTLWVKETWRTDTAYNYTKPSELPNGAPIYYDQDGAFIFMPDGKCRPSIFMPRRGSRITLEITDIRVERLNDISEADAKAEGIECSDWQYSCTPWKNYSLKDSQPHSMNHSCASASYRSLWESINGKGSWALNPWVWVIEFKQIKGDA